MTQEVQPWGQYEATGLEDMTTTDAVIPRIKIVHDEGYWEDNLTQSPMPTLYFVVLGLVKQRVLFHPNVEDGDVPMCKSADFQMGYTQAEAPKDKSKIFPWQASGFDPNDFPAVAPDSIQRALPCSGCALKDWGSHPTSSTPYCAEQWTMPIYFDASGQGAITDPTIAFDESLAEWTPAILTLQKSSIKPIKSYLSSFKGANKPPFLNICKGTLKTIDRGQVTYSVPNFTKGPESPRERWNEFAVSYGEMKTYLQRPPIRDEEDGLPVEPADNTYTGPVVPVTPAPAAQPAPAQPQVVQGVVEPAPAAQAQDPWTGQQVAQPAAAAPTPTPMPTQPVAPVEPTPMPAQPVAQPEPTPMPTPAPAQPAAAAPAAQPEQPKPAGTKLPF